MAMEKEALRDLANTLADIKSGEQAHDFLLGILTPRERRTLGLRWQLVKLLRQGMTQRAIASELGVSLCKITRGSRELKFGPKGFRSVVEKAARTRTRKKSS